MNEQKQPLVTVAMVTYNSEKFIRPAIESILCQSYSNLELVIGDDNSKDQTWEIVQAYSDRRIVSYRNPANLTQYPNRNRALEKASGKYIIYIDGDDMMYPHGLEVMVKMIEAFPHCGMALMYWFRSNLFYPVEITSRQFFTAEFFHIGFVPTALSNVLFTTEALRSVGGFPTAHISSDIQVRYRIALRYSSLLINDNLTWWRVTPGQQSGKVMKTMRGSIESYLQKSEILDDERCPFNDHEKEEARFNIERIVARLTMKQLLKLNLRSFIEILPYFSFRLKYFLSNHIQKDPFTGFTASHPFMVDFAKSPFSKTYNGDGPK